MSWQKNRTLYGLKAQSRITRDVRASLEDAFGPPRAQTVKELVGWGDVSTDSTESYVSADDLAIWPNATAGWWA